MNRRRFLQAGLAVTFVGQQHIAQAASETRRLSLFGVHTREFLDVEYFKNGEYLPDALTQIDHALRDHRENETTQIDTKLIDLLYRLNRTLAVREPFRFISGFRTQKTNTLLRAQGRGVAKRSYHIQGRAIDILPPGVPLADLVYAARADGAGGVGMYSRIGFVHLDTGPVRHWGR